MTLPTHAGEALVHDRGRALRPVERADDVERHPLVTVAGLAAEDRDGHKEGWFRAEDAPQGNRRR